MLKDLFPKVFRRYENSDFGTELEAFAQWLQVRGYIRAAIRRHVYRAIGARSILLILQFLAVFASRAYINRKALRNSGAGYIVSKSGVLVPIDTLVPRSIVVHRQRKRKQLTSEHTRSDTQSASHRSAADAPIGSHRAQL
jgi:hypothetical protein